MTRKAIFALTLVLGLALSDAALACSCAPPPEPAAARDQADAVFSAKVLDITQGRNSLQVQVQVERVWKGAHCGTVTVRTASDSAACGYSFEVGRTYLIYAFKEGGLSTNLCSRTRLIEEASEDLAALGAPEKTCG